MSDRMNDSVSDPMGDRPAPSFLLPPCQRRPLRVLLLGDRQDVLDTIKNLHHRGFAPAGEWSRAIGFADTAKVGCPTADEVMQQVVVSLPADCVLSILTKYFS
ncbi:MAG: hypothetical protein HC881_06800 [Leptolyngbyaceae cyanobacterium SL_7_1]|nr:hypothetical protein [Leptolyngbyaceae cyanobacterium SL_7_1]